MELTRRDARLLVTILLVSAGGVVQSVVTQTPVAAAAIANVQIGTAAQCACAAVTPALGAASTAGNLLVATVSDASTSGFSAPAGWIRAAAASGAASQAEIWYYPNNPGGITSATFTSGGLVFTFTVAQLSEWSGVVTSSPLEASGTATAAASGSVTASTSGATTVSGELGIASFTAGASAGTFTRGAGWNNLGGSSSTLTQYTADYRLGLAAGAVSDAQSSTVSGAWGAVIATFKPVTPCTGGVLGLSAPASVDFGTIALTGQDQAKSTNVVLTPDDESGALSGWKITGTSTLFTNAGGKTLPASATTVSAASAATVAGSCTIPTNTVSYSPAVVLPAGSGPPTPAKLFNAAGGSGAGPNNVTLTFGLAIPANAYNGSFSSTWTFAIASGP